MLQLNERVSTRNIAKANILLVDDRPDGLLALEAVLSHENYNLIKASSGPEALRQLIDYEFAVILLDVQMPEMDGFETAQYIRRNPACKETPIIFVTAISQDHQHVNRGYATGAVDYIFKPINDFILKSKIRVFVELYNKKQTIREQAHLLHEMEMHKLTHQQKEIEMENLRRYANLANAIPHIVFKAGKTGKIEYVNETWRERYAPKNTTIDELDWRSALHPDDLLRVVRSWMVKDPETSFRTEARIRDNSGNFRWHLISMVAEVENTEIIGWIGTCIDIQDQKNREHELRLLSENLNRSNKDLEQFAYIASHDMQEPLRKIISFTELIKSSANALGPDEQQYFNRIYQSGYRMKAVIEDLLQYSRISRLSDGAVERLDLNKILQDVLLDLEVSLAKSGGQVCLSPLPTVTGSSLQVRLLFQNLLSNAIKFAKREVPPKINIEARKVDNGGREIQISDNGIGFEEKYLPKIFLPFQRLHGKDEYEGTGVGLSIVKKITDHHGWQIKATSRLNVGSNFTICIPSPLP